MTITTLIISIILYTTVITLTNFKPHVYGGKLFLIGIIRAAVGIATGCAQLLSKTTTLLIFVSLLLHVSCGIYMCLYYNSAYNKEIRLNKKTTSQKKWLAILYGFVLGGLGIHKFYTNKRTAGAFYLLFSVTGIPIILGYIDAFRLIPKKESDIFVDESEESSSRPNSVQAEQFRDNQRNRHSSLFIRGTNHYDGVCAEGQDIDNCEVHVQFDEKIGRYTCVVENGIIVKIKAPNGYVYDMAHE